MTLHRPLTALAFLLLLLGLPALAEDPARDARGWLPGPVAANATAAIQGIAADEMPEIELPKAVRSKIDKPTVIFYFSPTCPHCRAVAREVEGLATQLKAHEAQLLWVASGGAGKADIAEFVATYAVSGTMIHDTDRELVAAIGARSTPSALLVLPQGAKGKVKVADIWYPYVPGFDGVVEARVAGQPFVGMRKGEYQGNNHCGVCHTVEHLSWAMTHHSIAWYTLEERNKQDDPACNGCHVTGKGEPTGWDGSPHSHLTDVGCESCHGPGGPHDGEAADPKAACEGCHDAKHSIAFSVEKGLPGIDHFRSDHVSDKAFDAHRRKLYKGELPRDLLAFAEGKNVGAAACLECHETEHADWSSGPHASAMASLKGDEAKKPECVACHATAKQSGPPPSELASFHLLDGVGCESCHGPGEKHLANPTADTIEGLGEDCPVCVIEAVCTSCHTQEWDPEWDLDAKLPRAGHEKK